MPLTTKTGKYINTLLKKILNRKDKNELETAIANYWFDSVRGIIFWGYTSDNIKTGIIFLFEDETQMKKLSSKNTFYS